MKGNGRDISIVVPCYNARRYLGECLASIVATCSGCEVVVVDDGSTEEIADIVERFPSVRLVRQANQGPGAARNRGILETTGEYVRFVDADDCLLSAEALDAQVSLLCARPEIGLVHGRAIRIDADGRRLGVRRPGFARGSYVVTGDEELTHLLLENYITTSSVIVRRSILDQIGLFRPDLPTGQDYEMWLRIARVASIGYVDAPVAAYRVHGKGITARKTWSQFEHRSAAVQQLFEDPEFERRYGALRPLIEARRQWALAQRAYMHGQMASARGQARALIRPAVARGDWGLGLSATRLVLAASLPQPVQTGLRVIARRARGFRLTARGLGHG